MELTITNTNETFESWLDKEYVDDNLKSTLSKASILIVPFENLRETANPYLFPIGTEDILRFFNENLSQEQLIDICISDEFYQEFAFYSDYKRLGNFIVKAVAVPMFVSIMSAYVYDRFIKEDDSKPKIEIIDKSTNITINNEISTLTDKKYLEPTHVKFSVTVIDSAGSSKNISFEGPATDIDKAFESLKEYEK